MTQHLKKKEQANVDRSDAPGHQTGFISRLVQAGRYIPLYRLALCYLLVSLILRLVLSAFFGPTAHVAFGHFPAILALGLVNDLVELLYLLAPFSLYLLIMPQRAYCSRPGRVIMAVFLWLVLFGMFYLAAVQFFFFQEFDARFNLVAVDYLIYPHEVLVNIWQS